MHKLLRKLFVRLLLPLLVLAGCTHAPSPASPSPTPAVTAVTENIILLQHTTSSIQVCI